MYPAPIRNIAGLELQTLYGHPAGKEICWPDIVIIKGEE